MTDDARQTWQEWISFSVNDIPEPWFSQLQAASDLGESECMRIGTIVLEMIEVLEAERLNVPRMRLYKAAGIASRRAAETVRMYAGIVKYVPAYIWGAHPDLGHHQFRDLIPTCQDDPKLWDAAIAAWREHCEKTGIRTSSVDGLNGWLRGLDGQPPAYEQRWARFIRLADQLISDNQVPQQIQAILRTMILAIEQWCGKHQDRATWLPKRAL